VLIIVHQSQEAEQEKESIKAQFAAAEQQKADINAEQRPLLEEQTELRKRLEEFAERHQAIVVGLNLLSEADGSVTS
jgi:chromosome segregation ATPase